MKPAHAFGAMLLALGLGLVGCADQDRSAASERPAASASASAERRPVDPALIAFLSKARAAHHQADLAETKSDISGAVRFLDAIPNGALPKPGPEVSEVLSDAYARLADLKSREGRVDDAARDIDQGLELAKETTHFRGHLFEMRGIVEQRRMDSLIKAGDLPAAEKAKQAALAAFEQAVEIQDAVVRNALKEVPPGVNATPSAVKE